MSEHDFDPAFAPDQPLVLVVAPHTWARAHGSPDELHVGWQRGDRVWWWGSCKNESALESLLANAAGTFGAFTVDRRETDAP